VLGVAALAQRLALALQFLTQFLQEPLPMQALALDLLGVVADHVAASPLTVTDHDLLDAKGLGQFLVAASARHHLRGS
jgi:hypothetical protein